MRLRKGLKPLWLILTFMHLLAGFQAVRFYRRNPYG